MGNQLSAQPLKQSASPGDVLAEVPQVTYKATLGGGRFLKTVRCVHDDGGELVVKVYFKREDSPELAPYERRLREIATALAAAPAAHPHVWPFQRVLQTERAAYLLRQHLFSDLHDRTLTRPFLAGSEKKWLAFQMLCAVHEIHERGICHGDIKLENMLVTSWNWVFLADFASFKPAYLPADNPADFSFFFDTGGRRRCYIAPERFYESDRAAPRGPLTPAADIFSLGCCIAEMFLDGTALFDLSQLLAYRRGEYDPSMALHAIEDEALKSMVLHMIQPAADMRLSAAEYMAMWNPLVFPRYFTTKWHDFNAELITKDTDAKVAAMEEAFPEICASILEFEGHSQVVPVLEEVGGGGGGGVGSRRVSSIARNASTGGFPSVREGSEMDLNNLLLDAETHAAKLENTHLGAVDSMMGSMMLGHGDAGFLLDDAASASSSQPPGDSGGGSGSGVGAEGGSVVEEVFREEVYEQQVREAGGKFSDHALSGTAMGGRRKEDVALPPGEQWQWTGPWEVTRAGGDVQGWMYRQPSDSKAGGGGRWTTADPGDGCLWRRRLWVRKRKQRSVQSRQRAVTGASGGPGDARLGGTVHERWKLPAGTHSEGMVLVVAALCSMLRGARSTHSKNVALALLNDAAAMCDDDTRLQRVVPYLLSLLSEASAAVRAGALKIATRTLAPIDVFAPSDSKIFPEYIFPALSLLSRDPEELVRTTYATCVVSLAQTAQRFLTRSQYMDQVQQQEQERRTAEPKADSPPRDPKESMPAAAIPAALAAARPAPPPQAAAEAAAAKAAEEAAAAAKAALEKPAPSTRAGIRYDDELHTLRISVREVVQEYLTPVKQTDRSVAARCALLANVGALCEFFGRKMANDFLLPLLITTLNDRSWELRSTFFEHIASVAKCVGRRSLEAFLLPCIEQALMDSHTTVVASALGCLGALCGSCGDDGDVLMQRRAVLRSAELAFPLLCHPSSTVRSGALKLIPVAAEALGPVDSAALLMPLLWPFLWSTISVDALQSISELRGHVRPPVSYDAFERALQRVELDRPPPAPSSRMALPPSSLTQSLVPPPRAKGGSDGVGGVGMASSSSSPFLTHGALNAMLHHMTHEGEADGGEEQTATLEAMAPYLRSLAASLRGSSDNNVGSFSHSAHGVRAEGGGGGGGGSGGSGYGGSGGGGRGGTSGAGGNSGGGVARSRLARGAEVSTSSRQESVLGASSGQAAPMDPWSVPASAGLSEMEKEWNRAFGAPSSPLNPPGAVAVAVATATTPGRLATHAGGGGGPLGNPSPRVVMPAVARRGDGDEAEGTVAGMFSTPADARVPMPFKLKGVLVAHLQEHRRAVRALTVSQAATFVASASDDGTVKVWDCRRLEKDVSFRSRVTYAAQGGCILACTACDQDHQVASGSSNGSVHVWRVEYVPRVGGGAERYTGSAQVRKVAPGEGAVLSVKQCGPLLLYATQRGAVHAWDLRAPGDAFTLRVPQSEGLLEHLALDPFHNTWLVTGSSAGQLSLWDLRFQLRLNVWRHPGGGKMEAVTPSFNKAHPLLWIAAGKDEVALWDVQSNFPQRVLRVLQSADAAVPPPSLDTPPLATSRPQPALSECGASAADPNSAAALRTTELDAPPQRPSGFRAVLPMGNDTLLTAGSDCAIRFWDTARADRCEIVCAPAAAGAPAPVQHYDVRSLRGVPVLQEVHQAGGLGGYSPAAFAPNLRSPATGVGAIAAAAQLAAGTSLSAGRADAHRDCINAMAIVHGHQRLVVSGSRDGIVKVWK